MYARMCACVLASMRVVLVVLLHSCDPSKGPEATGPAGTSPVFLWPAQRPCCSLHRLPGNVMLVERLSCNVVLVERLSCNVMLLEWTDTCLYTPYPSLDFLPFPVMALPNFLLFTPLHRPGAVIPFPVPARISSPYHDRRPQCSCWASRLSPAA